MKDENRLIAVLQVFTIILVFKGIAATYLATKYSYQEQHWLIERATHIFTIIPLFLLLALVLISIPLIWKQAGQKLRGKLDIIAVLIILLGIMVLFIL